MTLPARDPVDRLIAAQEALIAALDRDAIGDIEAALATLRPALDGVRGAGGWRETPEVVTRLAHALKLADAARTRLACLADRTRRQIDRLAALGAGVRAHAYGRDGRVRAG